MTRDTKDALDLLGRVGEELLRSKSLLAAACLLSTVEHLLRKEYRLLSQRGQNANDVISYGIRASALLARMTLTLPPDQCSGVGSMGRARRWAAQGVLTVRLRIAAALFSLALPSCSITGPAGGPPFVFPGLTQSEVEVLSGQAEAMYERVSACADAAGTRPSGVVVELFPPVRNPGWRCPIDTGGCIFEGYRRIHAVDWRLGSPESFGHELIHLSRHLKSGDPDALHLGDWWIPSYYSRCTKSGSCRSCQVGLEDLAGSRQ